LFVIQKTTNMRVIKATFSLMAVFLAATTISYAQMKEARVSPHDTLHAKDFT
jgi:hypothetical protein